MADNRNIDTFTIESRNGSIKITPEARSYPWWRQLMNKETEGIVCPEIVADAQRIAQNLSKDHADGRRVGKYSVYMKTLSPKPRSSQGKRRKDFKRYLVDLLKNDEADLLGFRDKSVLIYIAVYLRGTRFNSNDTDNFIKAIIDAIKVYIGDDRNVQSVIAEKKRLGSYSNSDLDFLEQTLLVITEPEAKRDILC